MNPDARRAWDAFAALLPPAGLAALADALACDDPRLVQGATTVPPPLMCNRDRRFESGDAVAFAIALGFGLKRVGEVERLWFKACLEADQELGLCAACRHFLNYWDDTPRPILFRELLALLRPAETRHAGTRDAGLAPVQDHGRPLVPVPGRGAAEGGG